MEDGGSKPRLLPKLSLYPQLLENIPTKPPVDTSASFFSCIDHHDDERKPPTLSLFPEFSENLSAYNKPNTSSSSSTTYPTFTALSLSLPYGAPDNFSTNSNNKQPDNNSSPIISQDSQNLFDHDGSPVIDAEPLRVIFNKIPGTCNAWGHCAPKRFSHESVGPIRKKSRVSKELKNNVEGRLVLQPENQENQEVHWITKKLTKSDVNGASRILLPKQEVKAYVLPFLGGKQAIECQSLSGTDITVWDLDTQSAHDLKLNKWSTGSFQLINGWTMEFVKRRDLKIDDVIALRWDKKTSRFYFRVQSRHQVSS